MEKMQADGKCQFCDAEKDIDKREILWEMLDFLPLTSMTLECHMMPESDDYIPTNVVNEYEHNGPRLMFTLGFRDSREAVFAKRINYCPMCGRKLEAE